MSDLEMLELKLAALQRQSYEVFYKKYDYMGAAATMGNEGYEGYHVYKDQVHACEREYSDLQTEIRTTQLMIEILQEKNNK